MSTYITPNRHGYSVRFSPFHPERLAVATSQLFGLAGGGTLFILQLLPSETEIIELQNRTWTDGLFDVVWSENNDSIIVTTSGDGGLQLWDLSDAEAPPVTFSEHKKEVYSVDWTRTRQQQFFLSASWDCTIKLWDPYRRTSLNTFSGHTQLVYSAVFSNRIPNCFASVSGDGNLKLWNYLQPQGPSASFRVHDAEVLACDWSKYDENILVTSGSDGLIRGWDIRNYTQPIFQFKGGNYAVRRVQFSPHFPSVLASVGYDFTTKFWDYKGGCEPIETIKHHSEFVYGLDWNCQKKGEVADCGWDSLVHIFNPKSLEKYE